MMLNRAIFEGPNATSMLSKIIKCLGVPSEEDLKSMKVEDEEISLVHVVGNGIRGRMMKING